MATFKDSKGREWNILIHLGAIRRLKAMGKDFYALVENKFASFIELGKREDLVVEWIWAIISPEAEKLGVTLEEFESSLSGESLGSARGAFAAAFADFFPDEATRSALKKCEQMQENFRAEVAKELEKRHSMLMEASVREFRKAADKNWSQEKMESLLAKELESVTKLNGTSSVSAGS